MTIRQTLDELLQRTGRIESALVGSLDTGEPGILDRMRGYDAFIARQKRTRAKIKNALWVILLGVVAYATNDVYDRVVHRSDAAAVEAGTR